VTGMDTRTGAQIAAVQKNFSREPDQNHLFAAEAARMAPRVAVPAASSAAIPIRRQQRAITAAQHDLAAVFERQSRIAVRPGRDGDDAFGANQMRAMYAQEVDGIETLREA
jgi:hypothetical protein